MRHTVDSRLRAVLMSIRLLGQTLGLRLAREASGRHAAAATILDLRFALARADQEIEWLTARLARVPPRHRPHYTPTERWQWLECRRLHGWSLDDTARHALVTATTIARWEREATAADGDRPPIARPTPPIRRFADAVRALIQLMDRCGVGGNALIARTLLRAGWRVSPETVRRIRRERPIVGPTDACGTGVIATWPNHVWLIDLTSIGGVFRATTFRLAVVLDAFARRPLAWRVFAQTPTARQMTRLLQTAIDRRGGPVRVDRADRTLLAHHQSRGPCAGLAAAQRGDAPGPSAPLARVVHHRAPAQCPRRRHTARGVSGTTTRSRGARAAARTSRRRHAGYTVHDRLPRSGSHLACPRSSRRLIDPSCHRRVGTLDVCACGTRTTPPRQQTVTSWSDPCGEWRHSAHPGRETSGSIPIEVVQGSTPAFGVILAVITEGGSFGRKSLLEPLVGDSTDDDRTGHLATTADGRHGPTAGQGPRHGTVGQSLRSRAEPATAGDRSAHSEFRARP